MIHRTLIHFTTKLYVNLQQNNPQQVFLGSLKYGSYFTRRHAGVWRAVCVMNHGGRSVLHGDALLQNGLEDEKKTKVNKIFGDI